MASKRGIPILRFPHHTRSGCCDYFGQLNQHKGRHRSEMRVLGLHGKQQNANVFITRTSKLINKAKKCNLISDFVCIDGPHELPLRSGDEVPMRAWYTRGRDGVIDQATLEEALAQIENVWRQKGPFDGLLTFSMGGSMAAIVASMPHRFPGLRFVILVGAPDIDERSAGLPLVMPAQLRSLHLIGMEDRAVLPDSSRALAARFTSPCVVEHELGHCIPMKAAHVQVFMDFLQAAQASPRTLPTAGASPIPPRAGMKGIVAPAAPTARKEIPLYVCSTDDIAALQSEEAEVLGAIYPEELNLLPPGSAWPLPSADSAAAILPTKAGDPCVAFHIALSLDPELFDPGASAGFPLQWVGNVGLLFRLPGDYPLSAAPVVSVTTGKLTLSDGFSDARIESLERTIQAAVVSGEAAALVCIQAAADWFSTGQWRAVSTQPAARKSVSGVGAVEADESTDEGDSDSEVLGAGNSSAILAAVDEAEEAEHIRIATAEACEVACRMRQLYGHLGLEKKCPAVAGSLGKSAEKSSGSKDQPAALLPPSARGVWNYTVGLVGKPSAGKSTFYNAVTRAALERGGRLMAEVAPHPFTTIEPNIGPGWYASFEQEGEFADVLSDPVKAAGLDVHDREQYRRHPLHGRCPAAGGTLAGRRLLPVVVKDVAGLVPGAYKGRGKGNRFLADLCDADVLVHVVDVTGKADRDGNAVITEAASSSSAGKESGDRGSSPMEDAEWIREELHRWIHGNVRGKWSSVVHTTRTKGVSPVVTQTQRDRCAQRVLALFTGYQGPRWCVERAAERAGLELERASLWGALDLHRMVAHFLCIRFPVCLALNKIDALGSSEEELAVIVHCQEAARLKGEVAVPVSARAECFVLNSMAAASIQAGGAELSAALKKGTSAQEAAIHSQVVQRYGTSGVLETISAAVLLKPPVLCYPVCDLDSECPVGWTSGKACAAPGSSSSCAPRLQDCLQMKPGSTVGDVFEALRRGELHGSLQGEFVRADSRCLGSSRVLQLRRDAVLEAATAVLRIQTNRKSVWQQQGASEAKQ